MALFLSRFSGVIILDSASERVILHEIRPDRVWVQMESDGSSATLHDKLSTIYNTNIDKTAGRGNS